MTQARPAVHLFVKHISVLTLKPCCVSPGLARLSDGSWSVSADGKLCVYVCGQGNEGPPCLVGVCFPLISTGHL